jgi:hypothetical protein
LQGAARTIPPPPHQQHHAASGKAPIAVPAGTIDLTASSLATNPLWQFFYLPSGDVLFSNNRTTLDLRAPEFNFTLSSQIIISLDDVTYSGNQAECTSVLDIVFSDVVALGNTIRASDNRFQEGFTLALYSLISVGLLMNTTALNQATHCIIPLGLFDIPLIPDNSILYKLDYCYDAISSLSKYFEIPEELLIPPK